MEKSLNEQLNVLKTEYAKAVSDFHAENQKDTELLASLQAKLDQKTESEMTPSAKPVSNFWDEVQNKGFNDYPSNSKEDDRTTSPSSESENDDTIRTKTSESVDEPISTEGEPRKIPVGSFRSPDTNDQQQAEYENFKLDLSKKIGTAGGVGTIFNTLEHHQEFLDLPPGKKMLVAQSVMEDLRTKVKTEAQKAFQEKASTPLKWADKVPVVGWLGKKLKGVAYGINKNALTQKYEQKTLADMTYMSDGEYVNKVGLKYIKGYADQNLDAFYTGDGKVIIDFAKTKEFGNSVIAWKYNEAATALARIPQSWSVEKTATKEQYREWLKAKVNFDNTADLMTPLFRDHAKEGNLSKHMQGAIDANFAKRQVEFFSFISQNPNTANELQKIATSNAFTRTFDSLKKFGLSYTNWNRIASLVTGAGVRVGVGAGVSTALAGTALGGAMIAGAPIVIGTIAAAAAGGTVGYFFRGDKIAKDRFKQQAIDARAGELGLKARRTQPGTLATVSRIKRRTEQVQKLTKQLSDLGAVGGTPIQFAQLSNQLRTHLSYIEDKIKKGEMNFGDADSQYINHTNLMMAKQEADIAIEMTRQIAGKQSEDWENDFRAYINYDNNEKILETTRDGGNRDSSNNRRLRLLAERQESGAKAVATAQKEAIRVQKWESAKMGALFGTIGSYASQWFYGTDAGHAVREATQGVVGAVKGGAGVVEPEVKHIPSTETVHTPTNTPVQKVPTPDTIQTAVENPQSAPTQKIETGSVATETTPDKTSQIDIENAFTKIKIQKGEGMGDALLKLRNTPSFKILEQNNPKLAGFFKGNIWDEAQKLHAFRPGNADGDSLVVGEGSELGVSPDGDIYLINTLKPGHPQLLGHIDPQTGEFTDVPPNSEFHYRSPRHHSVSHESQSHGARPHNTEGSDAVEEASANRPRNTEGPDEIRNAERGQTGNEVSNENRINRPRNTEGPDAEPVVERPRNTEDPDVTNTSAPAIKNVDSFTKSDWNRVHNISHRDMHDDLNHYFGKRNFLGVVTQSGEKALPYQSLAQRDAGSIMEHFKKHSGEFKPEVQQFLKHTQALAQAHPHVSPTGKFGQYIENLYKADATEFVAKNPNIDPK